MRLALILNPDSGSSELEPIRRGLREAGAEVEEVPIEQADMAARSEVDRIAVAGGDGSLAVAAVAARDRGVPLAVIPSGTANDFAVRMNLPGDLREAAGLAAGGEKTRAVDLGRVGGRAFVNVASLGLPPRAAREATGLKARLGPLAYTVGAMRAGMTAEPLRCLVSCDGRELHAGEAWQVTIGCSGAFGAGARIDADADDGRLDVVLIEGGPRSRLIKHAYGMRAGRLEAQRGVKSARCAAVELSGGSLELNVDGEIVPSSSLPEPSDPLRCGVEHRAFDLVIG